MAAYSSLLMTVGLVVAGPRFGAWRIGPGWAALAGVIAMMAFGVLTPTDLTAATLPLARPLVAIASIMIMTAAAQRVGVLDWLATRAAAKAGSSRLAMFRRVFLLSVASSAVLNNDAAVLLLMPIVVSLARHAHPSSPRFTVACAFAVFMAAGVAPLVVANPMNLIVASVAGIGFVDYAVVMVPIAIAGWIVSYAVLRIVFRRDLIDRDVDRVNRDGIGAPAADAIRVPAPMTVAQKLMILLVAAVLVAYPIVSMFGGPVWIVALGGALGAAAIAGADRELVTRGVSWEILGFLIAAGLLAQGLQSAGVVARLSELYDGAGVGTVGVASALGSAAINNHPMSMLNLLALTDVGAGHDRVFAALIGGDLGPRLLPIGSLAGLLWFASLGRLGVRVSLRQFIAVGAAVAIPSLAVSLALLQSL